MYWQIFLIIFAIASIFLSYYIKVLDRFFSFNSFGKWLLEKDTLAIIFIFIMICSLQYYFIGISIINYLILLFVMYLSSIVDFKSRIIPNILLINGAIFQLIQLLIFKEISLKSAFLGVLIGFSVFLIISIISKEGLGMGDVKLMAIAGLSLGASGVFRAMIISILVSGITAGFLMLIRKIGVKDSLPFAPFIFAGTIISTII